MTTGLTHVVLLTPKRRADLTLPEHVPLAHLHATLLRHGGEDLVEDGVPHGGWIVRKVDGTRLEPTQSLAGLGIRNGEMLLLSHRDQHWPEPTFDDLADGVAEDAARLGAVWRGATSRIAGAVTAGVILAAGLTLSPEGWVALAVATVLLGFAILVKNHVLGVFGMVYAAYGGFYLVSGELLVASAALLLAAVIGAIAIRGPVYHAGATLGVIGVLGTLVAQLTTPVGAVAATAAGLIVLAPLLPRFALHQGGLPTPRVPNPAHGETAPEPMPRPEELAALVKRSDELLTGVLAGACAALLACVATLGRIGDGTAIALAVLVVVICGLRMRMFAAIRHRLPLGLAALGGAVALFVQFRPPPDWTEATLAVLLLLASAAFGTGAAFAKRRPAPGWGRFGDIVEVLCIIATPVLACAVMGLFGLVRGLLNG